MLLCHKRRNNNNNNRDEESHINGLYIELRGNITGMYTHQDDRRKAAVSMTTSRRLFCCIAATCIPVPCLKCRPTGFRNISDIRQIIKHNPESHLEKKWFNRRLGSYNIN